MSAVAWGPTAQRAQPPRVRRPLRAALSRPPLVQTTFRYVEVKLLSAIVASESLKLSDTSDGNRGDNVAVDRGDAVADIGIVETFSEETLEIVSFSDSPFTSSSPKIVKKKFAASVRVKTWSK